MAKDKFTFMDFVKRQGLANTTGVSGKEYEGKCIRLANDLRKYLDSSTYYVAGVDKEIDTLRKSNVVMLLSLLSGEVDVSEYDPYNFGIGYDELRHFSIDTEGNPVFESNNVHDWDRGEDAYKVYVWEDLTDYEKPAIEDILKQIVKHKLVA